MDPAPACVARFQVDTGPDADLRFRAWTQAQTGYPIVEAPSASFSPRVDAQPGPDDHSQLPGQRPALGLAPRRSLVHGAPRRWRLGVEPAQLAVGCRFGTDAVPYCRVFSPVEQGRKFDPDGTYIKRWVPELRLLPAASVHEPWRYTDLAPYPRPVVDHATERREALERYGHLRNQSRP